MLSTRDSDHSPWKSVLKTDDYDLIKHRVTEAEPLAQLQVECFRLRTTIVSAKDGVYQYVRAYNQLHDHNVSIRKVKSFPSPPKVVDPRKELDLALTLCQNAINYPSTISKEERERRRKRVTALMTAVKL